jgi:hypothetical protein
MRSLPATHTRQLVARHKRGLAWGVGCRPLLCVSKKPRPPSESTGRSLDSELPQKRTPSLVELGLLSCCLSLGCVWAAGSCRGMGSRPVNLNHQRRTLSVCSASHVLV